MPYINYDENGQIIGYTQNRNSESQICIGIVDGVLKNCLDYEVRLDDIKEYDSNKYNIIDGILTDISNTEEYKTKQKNKRRQSLLQEFIETKDANIYSDIYNAKLLRLGLITQEIHDARLAASDSDFETALNSFYTNAGLVKPTITE